MLRALLLLFIAILPAIPLTATTAKATSLSNPTTGRVIVEFSNNTPKLASYIAKLFTLPIVMENDILNFAVFTPPDPQSFINNIIASQIAKYVGAETAACAVSFSCGGGGGGGGGTPTGPSFGIAASPSSLTVLTGRSGQSTIQLASMNGYTGTVTLSAGYPPGCVSVPLTVTFVPSSLSIPSQGSASSSLTIQPQGSSTCQGPLSVTASDGTLVTSIVIGLAIDNTFTLSANPSSFTTTAPSTSSSTITISLSQDWSGTINLGSTATPSGPKITFAPMSITIPAKGTGTSTLQISTDNYAYGTYAVSISGTGTMTTGGSVTHYSTITYSVTSDFAITATKIGPMGGPSWATSTVTVSSTGFSGAVGFTASASGPCCSPPTFSFSPSYVNLGPGGTATSVMNVSTTPTTPSSGACSIHDSSPCNPYQFAVVGTALCSGPSCLTHTTTLSTTIWTPNNPLYPKQWGPADIRLQDAWANKDGQDYHMVGSGNRIIAIVDSGIYYDHPDLKPNLWTASDGSHGWNCIANNNDAHDDYGHGTLVAGVASALTNHPYLPEGIAGAAQEKIMSIKVVDFLGGAADADIACGIQWAADHGANVINLSLGCKVNPCSFPMTAKAIIYAQNKYVVIVAAAGNNNTNGLDCPACYAGVISVAALKQDDTLNCGSNYGSQVDVSAPGSNIMTTNWPQSGIHATNYGVCSAATTPCTFGSNYCAVDGTSLAAPFVSAVAAIWQDTCLADFTGQVPNCAPLNPPLFRQYLDTYVTSLGPNFGHGKPNVLDLLTKST